MKAPNHAPTAVPCACCNDPVEYITSAHLVADQDLGFVCHSCKFRLLMAASFLKIFHIGPCSDNDSIEDRGMV